MIGALHDCHRLKSTNAMTCDHPYYITLGIIQLSVLRLIAKVYYLSALKL